MATKKTVSKTEATQAGTVKAEPVKSVKADAPKAEKAAKAPARRAAAKVELVVEYQGRQVSEKDILAAVKADCKGTAVKTLEVYVKPEDGAVYYVLNGSVTGKVGF